MSINHASSRELQTIPGIGPFFAKEILKIRGNYGGFISSDQLLDIYRMDEEKLSEILPYLIIDPNEVNKLNVNTASEEQLRKHPLISRDMADRKSTRLNSSHVRISYAVFCLKKKK